MEPLLNIEEAARLLGLSPWTIRLRIHEGRLNPVRLGRRVLIEPSELQRLVNEAKKGVNRPGKEEQHS